MITGEIIMHATVRYTKYTNILCKAKHSRAHLTLVQVNKRHLKDV